MSLTGPPPGPPTVDEVVEWIGAGYVVVAPAEHGYLYLADAFSHDAVRTLHVLRGDGLGISAQVLLPSAAVLSGIAREISPEIEKVSEVFWPGLLSLNLRPHLALNWDLGDGKELDLISVRVPANLFLLEVLARSGPLASASAAMAGQPPLLSAVNLLSAKIDVVRICDMGELSPGPQSTILQLTGSGATGSGLTLLREGAISFAQLSVYLPELGRENSVIS